MKKSRIFAVCLMSVLMASMVSCGAETESGSNAEISGTSSESSVAEDTTTAETEETTETETTTEAVEISAPETSEKTKTEVEVSDTENENEEEYEDMPEENMTNFRAGVWEAPDCLYYFDEDGISGRTSSYETKTGVPFTYEINDDGSAVFHMGGAENNTYATVSIESSSRYTETAFILWEDDTETRLNYYLEWSDYDFENFYTDSELVEMVKEYHKRKTDNEPSSVEVAGAEGIYVPIDVYVDGELATSYSVNRDSLYIAEDGGDYREKVTD